MFRILAMVVAVSLSTVAPAPLPAQEVKPRPFRHARTCPKKCKTCQSALSRGLQYLAKNQQGDGSWKAGNGGTVVVTSLSALALMANGSTPTTGPYARNIEKAAQWLIRTVAPGHKGSGKTASGEQFEGFGNWDLGFAALFLGEYSMHVRTAALSTKLNWLIKTIQENREPNGGWGHAKDFAYKDLVVASTACLAGLGSLQLAGFKIPQDVVADGVKYYDSTGDGNGIIGYSPRDGQRGWGKAGRASGAGYAMYKLGLRHKLMDKVTKFCQKNVKTIPEDHASPTLHYLFGGLFSYVLGPPYWNEFRSSFLNLWLTVQKEDGSFVCPTESDVKKEMGIDMDAMVGPVWNTAVFCLVFQLPFEQTHLTKNRARQNKKSSGGGLGLKPKKPAEPGWMGLLLKDSGMGVTVVDSILDSPAGDAELQEGDMLISINGKTFANIQSLKKVMVRHSPGKKIQLVIQRDGQKQTLKLELKKKPEEQAGSSEGVEF